MENKRLLLWALAVISMLVYLVTVITIILFFGWFPALFFGLITGFLAFKFKSIYEDRSMRTNIIDKMNSRKKEGVFIGGKKFNLNKGVLNADDMEGDDPKPKPNLGDLDQLGKDPGSKPGKKKVNDGQTKKDKSKKKTKTTKTNRNKKPRK
jgi:hypothetical protein